MNQWPCVLGSATCTLAVSSSRWSKEGWSRRRIYDLDPRMSDLSIKHAGNRRQITILGSFVLSWRVEEVSKTMKAIEGLQEHPIWLIWMTFAIPHLELLQKTWPSLCLIRKLSKVKKWCNSCTFSPCYGWKTWPPWRSWTVCSSARHLKKRIIAVLVPNPEDALMVTRKRSPIAFKSCTIKVVAHSVQMRLLATGRLSLCRPRVPGYGSPCRVTVGISQKMGKRNASNSKATTPSLFNMKSDHQRHHVLWPHQPK